MNLSIIVPVYNAEHFLTRCLESIVPEMHDGYELILVDDGSTDASGTLCDEFAQRYPQLDIIVEHQPNSGPGAARNKGIEIAKGEYITFMDADDHIEKQTLTENMEILLTHREIDMLEYPIEVHPIRAKAYRQSFFGETQYTDVFADWIRREGYNRCYPCNKIYAARIWENLRFPVGRFFEDTAVMPEIVRSCRCIHYSDRGCYRYIMRKGSNCTTYHYERQRLLFEDSHRLYKDIKGNLIPEVHSLRLWICCLNQLIDMGRCPDVDNTDFRRAIEDVEKHRPSYMTLIRKSPDIVTCIKLLPLPITGLLAYCRLYIKFAKPL